ncbi:hypothetical protein [Mastigocoleus sp. MO_188.B34]
MSNKFVVTGSLDNIFNQRYQLFSGFPDAGRVFQVSVNAKF